jgi:hypothetical protein
MTLPNQFKSARMTNDTIGVDIDDNVADIEQLLCDILGFTIDTNITESPVNFDNAGRITKALMRLKAAGPVGVRFYNSTNDKEFRLVLDGTNVKVDENTGTEAAPVWTNRASMALSTGVWSFAGAAFTAIPTGPATDPIADNEFTRKKYVNDQDDVLAGSIASKVSLTGNEGIDGVKTFQQIPILPASDPTTDNQAARKLYVDLHGGGKVAQIVRADNNVRSLMSANIPWDDTIPQSTEGDQILSANITPTDSSSKLKIDVVIYCGMGSGNACIGAIFKDTDSSAIAAGATAPVTNYLSVLVLSHYMTAGTTSQITFKVRFGTASGNVWINGDYENRKLGGAMACSLTVTEIKP